MPSRPPRRRLPAAERRELIEQAALDLLAERGYHRTGMADVAAAAGVSVPVVYDHFASKVALHCRLLERTRDELLAMWRANLGGDGTLDEQVQRAFTAWAAYVQAHPFAPAVFFRETTGVEEIQRFHGDLLAAANGALATLMGAVLRGRGTDVAYAPAELAMIAEVVRGGLTELAIWWRSHPDVEAPAIVAIAMDTVWVGADRLSRGERWRG